MTVIENKKQNRILINRSPRPKLASPLFTKLPQVSSEIFLGFPLISSQWSHASLNWHSIRNSNLNRVFLHDEGAPVNGPKVHLSAECVLRTPVQKPFPVEFLFAGLRNSRFDQYQPSNRWLRFQRREEILKLRISIIESPIISIRLNASQL